MNFIKNMWYIAGESEDVSDSLTSRKLLDENIVLLRDAGGSIIALENRCPHRFAPLTLGRREQDGIRCGYHGAKFGFDGQCLEAPLQTPPKDCGVRSYTAIEKYGYVWVWIGDGDPDHEKIPSAFAVGGDKDWAGFSHYELEIPAYYELFNDNLFDITHAPYVHSDDFDPDFLTQFSGPPNQGTPEGPEDGVWVDIGSDRITYYVQAAGSEDPFFQNMLAAARGESEYRAAVHMQLQVRWMAPCYFSFQTKVTATTEEANEASIATTLMALIPNTERQTSFYFMSRRNFAIDDAHVTDMFRNFIMKTFIEDRAIVTAQSANMTSHDVNGDARPLMFVGDIVGQQGRRIVASLSD